MAIAKGRLTIFSRSNMLNYDIMRQLNIPVKRNVMMAIRLWVIISGKY